jgi:DNA-binding NarL/FixJ family response regulator
VVGEAASAEEALAGVPPSRPDVVLLDLSLPGMGGIEGARALRALQPGLRMVALTMHEGAAYVEGFFQAGGSGYVPKSSPAADLIDAVGAVARGEYFAPARLLASVACELARRAPNDRVVLTPREAEVVRRIAQGGTYREIAAALTISPKSVATYRERASQKLGVRSRAELVRWAVEHALLD